MIQIIDPKTKEGSGWVKLKSLEQWRDREIKERDK
jgi:hypothetical protein